MDDKRITELEEQLKAIQEELEQAKKEKADEEWPRKGDEYFVVGAFGKVQAATFSNDDLDNGALRIRNFFRTEQEAKSRADLLRWLADDPDRWEKIKIWREMVECAECVEAGADLWIPWRSSDGELTATAYFGNFGVPGFPTSGAAEDCISKIGDDRLKRYWFGVKE